MATLYLVSTPIGNLQDITLRAIEVLQSVDIILCEDTRRTGILLKRIQEFNNQQLTKNNQFVSFHDHPVKTSLRSVHGASNKARKEKLISFHDHNEECRVPQVLEWLRQGKNIALVSDAGMPLISDPGYKLVKRIRELENEQIRIEVIPGPSAVTAALVSSGFPPYPFLFLGYLPKKQNKRKKLLQELKEINQPRKTSQRDKQSIINNLTIIAFESPHRLVAALADIQEIFGSIEIAVCRELTKLHEEVLREKVSRLIKHFEKRGPKGEITIVWNV